MLRLTKRDRAVAEVTAVAEHAASLTGAAAVFQLRADVPTQPEDNRSSVPLLDATTAPDAAEVLAELAVWSHDALGIDHIPAIWRALAHQPRFLEATWRKDQLVMASGALDELTKVCAALAVAGLRNSAYCIAYYLGLLRVRCGMDDGGVAEVAANVAHYLSFNTIAHGMRLEPQLSELSARELEPDQPGG